MAAVGYLFGTCTPISWAVHILRSRQKRFMCVHRRLFRTPLSPPSPVVERAMIAKALDTFASKRLSGKIRGTRTIHNPPVGGESIRRAGGAWGHVEESGTTKSRFHRRWVSFPVVETSPSVSHEDPSNSGLSLRTRPGLSSWQPLARHGQGLFVDYRAARLLYRCLVFGHCEEVGDSAHIFSTLCTLRVP